MSKTPYLIEWVDSYGCSAHWENLDGCNPSVLKCRSIGWIVHRDKQCVVIVPHVALGSDSIKEQGCGDMTIPTASITKLLPVAVGTQKRRH